MQACRLGGISTGGWIVLSALAGMLVGTAATLLGQAVRRARQLKYLAAEPVRAECAERSGGNHAAVVLRALHVHSTASIHVLTCPH